MTTEPERTFVLARGALRCAFCHTAIELAEARRCPSCGTLLHVECHLDVRACPTLGCAWRTGGAAVEARSLVTRRRGHERAPAVRALLLIAVLVGGLLVVIDGSTLNRGRGPPSWAMQSLCGELESGRAGVESIPRLLEVLRDEPTLAGRWTSRRVVVARLGGSAVPALRATWRWEASPCVREWILKVFADLGPVAAGALPELVDALGDPDEMVVRAAIDAIVSVSAGGAELPPDCVPRLVAVMDRRDAWIDRIAVSALRRLAPNHERCGPAIVHR